jgi:glycerate-2-kinase
MEAMTTPHRDRIVAWYHQALEAVDPARVTREALANIEIGEGRLVVLAIGKAAVPMAQAARDVLGGKISNGLIVTKSGQLGEDVEGFVGIESAHPIPDQASLDAAEYTLELVSGLDPGDTVIALVSGGGSALLEYPAADVSLMDMQVTTELLMYAGGSIYDLNTVRKALSAIKGGGLRRAIGDARCITLMLSDVLGNDFGVIASGPTIIEPVSRRAARQVLADYRVDDRVPESVQLFLASDAPLSTEIDTSRDICEVVADNETFIQAMEQAARNEGLEPHIAWHAWKDDARDLAQRIVIDCRGADKQFDVLIGGGEATSIVHGAGKGGRNCETALQAALLLHDDDAWTIASLASDGDDGNSSAAGAVIDSGTVDDQHAAENALAESDSAGYLEGRDALVVPGFTGTNVNDVYIAMRSSAGEQA